MTTTTTKRIGWRELIVSEGDVEQGTTLGHLVDTDDTGLQSVVIGDGRIVTWPQNFVSAPGEDPTWDTPNVPVDWAGFEAAVEGVRRNLGA